MTARITNSGFCLRFGGADEDRTPDLRIANATLSSCRSPEIGLPVRFGVASSKCDWVPDSASRIRWCIHAPIRSCHLGFGGAEEDRTPDLRIANATLSSCRSSEIGLPCPTRSHERQTRFAIRSRIRLRESVGASMHQFRVLSEIWWSRGGSNSRPSHCERDALPN